MRPGGNPLDLNNFPEDCTRDGKHVSEDTSSSAGVYSKKKSGAKEGKEEPGKVYECRFCSLKFRKSQALGGHMNRHRQERETETLNKARQLVFTNDLGPANLGYVSSGQPIPHAGFHHQASAEPAGVPYRSIYPSRMFPPIIPPPVQPPPPPRSYKYTSPPHLHPFPSQYPVSDYFLGHALSNSSYASNEGNNYSSYTCIGAPVGHGLTSSSGGSSGGGVRDVPLQNNQEEGLNWNRK